MRRPRSNPFRLLAQIWAATGLDRFDVLAAAGAFLLVYGVMLIYPPAAFILAGLLLIAFAVIGAVASKRRDAAVTRQGGAR